MKRNKIVKKIAAGVMALSLCLGTSMVALAAPTEAPTVSLTKELAVAEGIQTPEVTFTFEFAQDTTDDNTTKTAVAIDPVQLKFTNADVNEGGKVVKESTNIIDGITWPNAGVYKYLVTETAGETTIDNGNGNGTMSYDTSVYSMQVVVKNGADGNTVVDKVVVKDVTDSTEGEKVEAAPSTEEQIEDTTDTENDENTSDTAVGNDFRFVNTYTKNGGGVVDPEDPTPDTPDPDKTQSALTITKNVVGELADMNYGFSFNLNLQLPATATVTEVEGYIYNEDGSYVSNAVYVNGDNAFTLAHGQYLTFKELPAGTTYTVKETGTANYTGETSTVSNDEAAVVVTGEKNADVVTGESLVGEKANATTVTNTYDDQSVTPTGIIVNNLPYIALILVAVAGCAVIIIGKKRRAA